MSSLEPVICPLVPGFQRYAWGKPAADATGTVAAMYFANSRDCSVEPSTPFAETWMGTHPTCPSEVPLDGEGGVNLKLSEFLQQKGAALSAAHRGAGEYDGELPYLFKVLSIRNALSIQSHPTKQRAAYLHQMFPEHYKDANHKPELALAVAPTLAMCGFRPLPHLYHFLCECSPAHVPELRRVVGGALCDSFVGKFITDDVGACDVSDGGHEHDGLHHHSSLPRMCFAHADSEGAMRELYSALMTASQDVVEANVNALVQRLRDVVSSGGNSIAWASLILDLHAQYGADIGIFSIYFFNVLSLKCGDAIFLAPCLPHAYIRGELVELMACSDNVVRAGLTPKHKHVDELLTMLNYSSHPPLHHHMQPVVLSSSPHASLKLFAPPSEFSEFCLLHCTVRASASFDIPLPSASPHILLCLQGHATVSIISAPSASIGSESSSSKSRVIHSLHSLLLAPVAPSVLRVTTLAEDATLYLALKNVAAEAFKSLM